MKWKVGASKKNRQLQQQNESATVSLGAAAAASTPIVGRMQGNKNSKNSSNKEDVTSASSSSIRKKKRHSAPSNMAIPAPVTAGDKRSNVGLFDGLGTIRVGLTRTDSAPICTPTPRAKRQLISELLEPDSDEDADGYTSASEVMSASPALRNIISNKSSSGKLFEQEAGKGDAFSSYTPEEKEAFASHLNVHLVGDRFLEHLLPLDPRGADLFNKFHDGVLMCRLVCLAIPGSIADAKINVPSGSEPLGLYKATENLNVALTAAEAAGLQVVNIGASDIIDGRPASILGLSWQLIRVHLLAQINLKRCPDLIHLMKDGETKATFFALPVEDVLLRWFNHHLRWGGSERRVSNFSDDLSDGQCYTALLKELNDNFQEPEYLEGEDAGRRRFRRACSVISGAQALGLAPLIRPNHITRKAHLYNIAFVAQLINRRPRIHRERLHLPAATSMQAWYRMLRTQRVTVPLIEQRRASATTIARAWRQLAVSKRQERAATALQAWRRGVKGREMAIAMRKEKRRAEHARAKKEASRLRLEKIKREEAAAREARTSAATTLQAWGRGLRTRSAVSAVLAARGLPPLGTRLPEDTRESSQLPPLSCHPHLKEAHAGLATITPRTSVSTMRLSEDSPDSIGRGFSFGAGGSAKSGGGVGGAGGASAGVRVGGEGKQSTGWFNKVFNGMSFNVSTRSQLAQNRADEAYAAVLLQRWRRQLVEARAERDRATREAAKRRWAARTLHKAYEERWRLKLAERSAIRRDLASKEEEARLLGFGTGKGGGWLYSLWNELVGGLTGALEGKGHEEEESGSTRHSRRSREGKGKWGSTADGRTGAYVTELVAGSLCTGEAQEARAKQLARVGTDARFWRSPEDALSPVNCAVMVAALVAAAVDATISHAAASGV